MASQSGIKQIIYNYNYPRNVGTFDSKIFNLFNETIFNQRVTTVCESNNPDSF